MANQPMHFYGYDIQRCRKKYRCPLVMVTFLPAHSLINVLHLLMVEFLILMMVIQLATQDLYHINLKLGRRYTRTELAPKE